jgi:hypothetical protein
MHTGIDEWAQEEFGQAQLGDERRRKRLIAIAQEAAKHPAGKLTQVFCEPAPLEAAFRFVENDAVAAEEISRAAHGACARRAAKEQFAFVPIDGSSLNITDSQKTKRLGVVGARSIGAQGLQVMTAIALSPEGVPLGICGQEFWTRPAAAKRGKGKHDRRTFDQKETRYWLDVMAQTRAAFEREAPKTKPWFQLDRGGDAWPVLLEGLEPGQLFTVRAAYDRRLWDEPGHYLWDEVEGSKIVGTYELNVQAGAKRKARVAKMQVRTAEVVLHLQDERTKSKFPAAMYAVLTREISPVPHGEDPIEWLLLTTFEVKSLDDARLVLFGYAQRWRIEEFHKAWKTTHCNVEDTLLGDKDNIVRWATVLASVAMRILRLMYLSRVHPETDATVEFEPVEVKAIVLLRKPKSVKASQRFTMAQVVRWVADLGGYTGKSSGGPPGAIVISRGLDYIRSAVTLLRAQDEM